MIAELKQKKELDKLYKQNTIELNDYFAYSGKIEIKGKFVKPNDDYIYKEKIIIKNDMSKYKLEKDRIDKIIKLKGTKKW